MQTQKCRMQIHLQHAASHLGSSSKRKGRSTSQGGAKKRALPLRSPRSSSAGPKLKAAPVAKSAKRIPGAASPHAKAVGKPAAKPPSKAIPLLGQAAAKPPPASVTAKPPPSTAGGAWQAPTKGKAPPTVAEREQHAAPRSPPLFAVDWSKFTSREAFLSKTSEGYKLDPNSAEGYNCHVSHKWHAQAITSVGCQEMKNHLIDVEQHSFMFVLMKVLATKAESYLMPRSQIEQVTTYLKTYEATFADSAQKTLAKAS